MESGEHRMSHKVTNFPAIFWLNTQTCDRWVLKFMPFGLAHVMQTQPTKIKITNFHWIHTHTLWYNKNINATIKRHFQHWISEWMEYEINQNMSLTVLPQKRADWMIILLLFFFVEPKHFQFVDVFARDSWIKRLHTFSISFQQTKIGIKYFWKVSFKYASHRFGQRTANEWIFL